MFRVRTGWKVPAPTWSVRKASSTPRARSASSSGSSKCSPAVGAAIGTVAGVFTGLVGLIFMPLVGAAIGEYLAQRNALRAGRVGVATWLGMLAGTAAKVAIVFLMVGIFVASLLIA